MRVLLAADASFTAPVVRTDMRNANSAFLSRSNSSFLTRSKTSQSLAAPSESELFPGEGLIVEAIHSGRLAVLRELRLSLSRAP